MRTYKTGAIRARRGNILFSDWTGASRKWMLPRSGHRLNRAREDTGLPGPPTFRTYAAYASSNHSARTLGRATLFLPTSTANRWLHLRRGKYNESSTQTHAHRHLLLSR